MSAPNLPPSTPIDEVWEQLHTPPLSLPAVRTLGDLLVEVERGNVADPAILKALGVKKKAKADAAE